MSRCPCKGCVPPKRTFTCHDTCTEYKEWKKMRADYQKKLKYENIATDSLIETAMKRKKKARVKFRTRRQKR